MCSIAMVHSEQGKHAEALAMWENVLRARVAKLGSDHVEPAKTKINIANALQQQGHLQPALEKCQEALPVLEATLGHEHPIVAETKVRFFPTVPFVPPTVLAGQCCCNLQTHG